ncbi:hypothetical protein [Cryptosporidium hominis TU502]|uniref:hypothetical protein n=1 Tax=Cryptosporidium hominis (strain TU502) TaxID=353151 RepID=UPI0000452B7B|nr:hypothetical protein [Cryptosporidium hominis TU502]
MISEMISIVFECNSVGISFMRSMEYIEIKYLRIRNNCQLDKLFCLYMDSNSSINSLKLAKNDELISFVQLIKPLFSSEVE